MGASQWRLQRLFLVGFGRRYNAWDRRLYGGYTGVNRDNTTTERFFSSLRSGLKTWACGGLDPLILCPFGTFVLTLVFSVRPPQSGVECGEVGCHRFRFERLSFLVHQAIPQAVLRPLQPPSIVRGTLQFFDGFDVVDGPSLRSFINGARMN